MRYATLRMTTWLIAACLASGPAAAGAAHGTSPYELDVFADTVATVGLGVFFGASAALRISAPYHPSCEREGELACDRTDLLAIDRYAVDRQSEIWLHLSDGAQIGALLLPYALDATDILLGDSSTPWIDLGIDATVILEAQIVTGIVVNLVRLTTRRPRPRQYDPQRFKAVPTSYRSFPSGHSLAVAVGASAYAMTFWLRHPDSPWRWVVLGTASVYAGIGAWARVEAGQHFPTDVIAGVAAGATIGLLVPWLHTRDTDMQVSVTPTNGGGSIGVSWPL